MATRINHQEIVKRVLDSKAVDFASIGKVVAELGPSISMADDPGDNICATMVNFVHFFRLPSFGNGGNPVIPDIPNSPIARN